MSTKAPATIIRDAEDSLENAAYAIAATIPVQEPNDAIRLGYCLWTWLLERKGTLSQMVHASGVRTTLSNAEIVAIIQKHLDEKGLKGS
jgi:hypothetical protein